MAPPWQPHPDEPELCRPEELPSDSGIETAKAKVRSQNIVSAFTRIQSASNLTSVFLAVVEYCSQMYYICSANYRELTTLPNESRFAFFTLTTI